MLLIEAEQFDNHGGWALDQQFMGQMGSPFLLAHGLGKPVADATTTIKLAKPGKYRIWVRTRDWTAPWFKPSKIEDTPGRFQLLANGKPLPAIFGTEGEQWHWQDGGVAELSAGEMTLALHDLTGFDGRCDAIILSEDLAFVPPEEKAEQAAFRRKMLGLPERPDDGGSFDLVVAGAGVAGICAAVVAARLGLKVALLNDRPVLGGNNSSEVKVTNGGNDFCLEPYPHVGEIVKELEDKHGGRQGSDLGKLEFVNAEPNITLHLGVRVVEVEKKGEAIQAVVAQDIRSAKRVRFSGRFFADCTGDGDVGFLAGADHDMTLTSHMGPTNVWRVDEGTEAAPFPRCPWAIDLAEKPFPGRGEHSAQWGGEGLKNLGQWFWESGFDLNPIAEAERNRDTNLRAMFGAWDALKNVDKLYPNHFISWVAFILGKRESRRLFGDVVVSRGDLFRHNDFPDGCVPCTWHMDLHVPHKDYQAGFEGEEFISWCVIAPFPAPFWLPYRTLYSRNINNLFMAGRDISVTHEALGGVRVHRTTGSMGEVVGVAASLCKQLNASPRGLYEKHLDKLLGKLRQGGIAKL